jgi:hypothetical protein
MITVYKFGTGYDDEGNELEDVCWHEDDTLESWEEAEVDCMFYAGADPVRLRYVDLQTMEYAECTVTALVLWK